MTKLALDLKKSESGDETKYSRFYSSSNAETIINESANDDVLE